MSRWFRFYDEALNDPKVQRLEPELFKFWVNFLCLASKNDGDVMKRDIAFHLRFIDEKAAEKSIDELIELNLVDEHGDVLTPHNWRKRQYKSDVSTNRVKQFRKRQGNVSETPPDTEQRQITEQKEAPPAQLIDLHPAEAEKQLFDRGKEILKSFNSGGLIKNLLKSKGGNIALARAALETASTKSDPREYIGAIIRGRNSPDDARARGDAW